MIVVITLLYCAVVLVAFKLIKIKVNPVSIASAALIGVFILTGVLVGWKMSAPMTGQMFLRRPVLQIIPDVREFVTRIHVKENQLLKKGDPIFEVLPDRYEDAVERATADLEAAKSTVSQLESAVTAAKEGLNGAHAMSEAAKSQLDTAQKIVEANPEAIAKLKVQEAQQAFNAAEAGVRLATANLKQTEYSLAAAKHGVEAAQSGLATVQFDLERCTYVAPFEGRIMNWQLTANTPVARWRFTAVGTMEDLSDTLVAAIFPQNQLKNVNPGDAVEIAFKRRPGQIISGKVETIANYTGEGQFAPTGDLPMAANVGSKGYLVVRIRLDDKQLARELPLGAAGTVAIYTGKGKPFHVISKIALRMKAWMNYLPF